MSVMERSEPTQHLTGDDLVVELVDLCDVLLGSITAIKR